MLRWFKPKKPKQVDAHVPIMEDFSDPDELYRYFTATTGITFEQKKSITTTKLINFARDHRFTSFASLLSALRNDTGVMESLINFLTVNETYFFREMAQIEFMARQVAASRKKVRILCAPGSTGEEPYTVAITLCEAGVDLNRVEIVSIDINTKAIERARQGFYSRRSLHRLTDQLIGRYFTSEGEKYRLNASICAHVRFEAMNIFDPTMAELGVFDYLFSRNMLIYFDQPTVICAVERLSHLARDSQSLFFFGHADILSPPPGLSEHYAHGVKYYTLRACEPA